MYKKIKDYILTRKKPGFLVLISGVSLIKALILFFIIEILATPHNQIGYFPDSMMYEKIADNILSGHGFSLSQMQPFMPTMYKEPLYPFFLAMIKSIPGATVNTLVFIQILTSPLIAILIYLIGKEVFNETLAKLSAFLVALIPIYGEVSFLIMPESMFIIIFSSAFLCLVKAIKLARLYWFVLAGLLLGLSSLCKNAVLPLSLLYPAAILFKNRKNIKWALALRLIVFLLSFFFMTVPWMARNQKELGLFSISRRGGEILSHQAAWAANFTIEEWKAYTLYLFSGNMAQRLYPRVIGNDLGNYEYAVLMRTNYVDDLLQKYSEGEVEKMLTREAIKNITKHPVKFLLLSEIIYVQTFKYFESASLMLIKGPAAFLSIIRFFLFIAGFLYTVFTFKGILYSKKTFDNILIIVTIFYFNIVLAGVGIIPGGLQRYILPVTVFYSYYFVIAMDRHADTISKAV